MLFQNRRISPARGAVELGDQRRAVFHARLIDAVLITVEGQQAAVAAQTDAVQRIEHGIGGERGEGLGMHGRIVRQAGPVHEARPIMKCLGFGILTGSSRGGRVRGSELGWKKTVVCPLLFYFAVVVPCCYSPKL